MKRTNATTNLQRVKRLGVFLALYAFVSASNCGGGETAAEDSQDARLEEIKDLIDQLNEPETSTTETDTTETPTGSTTASTVNFFPATFDFGEIRHGQSSTVKSLNLYNTTDASVYIGSIAIASATHFTLVGNNCPGTTVPLLANQSCAIQVKFVPTAGGALSTSVSVSYGASAADNTKNSASVTVKGTGTSSLTFTGLDSIGSIGGNSLTLNWTHVVGAQNYYVYDVTSGTPTLVTTLAAPTATYAISGLTLNTSYTYRVRLDDTNSIKDGNTNDVSATTLANPKPTVTSVSPAEGALAGGTTITITGTGFLSGITATVDGSACTSPTYVSATSMTCVTPAKTAGTYTVAVTNSDTQTNSLASAYKYQAAPTVTSTSPTSGSWEGSTALTITGTGFLAGATVTVAGITCTSPTVVSATSITCTTGAYSSATGGTTGSVVVTNSDSQTGTQATAYTYKFLGVSRLAGPKYPYGCRANTTAADARFHTPRGMVADSGNLYVVGYTDYTIWQVNTSTGASTAFSGSPCKWGSTNGTVGTNRIRDSWGITKHGTDFYFVSYGRHTVRRLDGTTGEITTVAGIDGSAGTTNHATGTSAKFRNPMFITSDGTYLYVADTGNHRIRRVDPSSSYAVTTFAGSSAGSTNATGTSAKFNNPRGITHLGGYLYVADYSNHRIRRIQISDQSVTTFAGSSSGHTNGVGTAAKIREPYGITHDGTNLYVAERLHLLRKIVVSTAAVSDFAGSYNANGVVDHTTASSARFSSPIGMATDGTYVYVGDSSSNIRRVNISTGEVSTLSGLYQTPRFNSHVDATGTAARFNAPYGLTTHGGNIYVADYSNHRIRQVNPSTGVTTTFTGAGSGGTDGTGTAAKHNGPREIKSHGSYLYVSDYGGRTIRRINANTQEVITLAGQYNTQGCTDHATGTSATMKRPHGLAVDSGGTYLYFADRDCHKIRRYNLSTTEVSTFAGSGSSGTVDGTGTAATFSSPEKLVISGNYLYVTSGGDHKIRRIDLTTAAVLSLNTNTAGHNDDTDLQVARFYSPRGLTTDGTYIYIADYGNHSIRMLNIGTGEVSSLISAQSSANGNTSQRPFYEQIGSGNNLSTAYLAFPYGITYSSTLGLIIGSPYSLLRVR